MNKKFKFVLISLFLITTIILFMNYFYPNFLSGTGRYELWKQVISGNKFPFLGNGIGSFAHTFKSGKLDVLHAHNEWIQFYYEGGLALVVLSFLYLFNLLKRVWLQHISDSSILLIGFTSSLFSYLVVMYGSFPLRIGSIALIFILIISCLEKLTRRFA